MAAHGFRPYAEWRKEQGPIIEHWAYQLPSDTWKCIYCGHEQAQDYTCPMGTRFGRHDCPQAQELLGVDSYDMLGGNRDAADAQPWYAGLVEALMLTKGAGMIDRVVRLATMVRHSGARVFFIGNGGSAGIASHMAADWLKAGHFHAMAFNDPALLTCLANDLGYGEVFRVPLTHHCRQGDLLFAISSSGESDSVVNAALYAKEVGAYVVTLSGFLSTNRLRQVSDMHFHVPSSRYGLVEVAHHTILHAILDRITSK